VKRSDLRHKLLQVVLALVLVAFGYGLRYLTARPSLESLTGLRTKVITVTKGSLRTLVSTTGLIQPTQQQSVSFLENGIVQYVDVTPGQQVTRGQILASLDSTDLQAALTQAQA
jgi:multidrug efflux pump subunit AcrA (membrane-fusion protein)